MLWVVAALVFLVVTATVRRYLRQDRLVPSGFMGALEIIVAGTQAHGFVQHWKNMVPKGLPWPIYFLLIPIEILGMFVRPFALTMRLAANMAGGHIAILALLSLIFVFTSLFGRAIAGIGVGMVLSLPIGVGLTALELIVILVQAYVFTLLTAVFIGMAIHAHH
jgi:F-type H+-transporting ATPase subunit a